MNKTADLQILLPFAEKEYVDVRRTCRILGVSETTVHRLASTNDANGVPLLHLIEYRPNARKRVLYSSIVRFCDRLREQHWVPDNRPKLDNPMFRHRDEDLLPFPLSDTIPTPQALNCLGYSSTRSLNILIEQGHFWAYRLMPEAPWRISRSSFAKYLEQMQRQVYRREEPYKKVSV